MKQVKAPGFGINQRVMVLPLAETVWPPFEAIIIERRHIPDKGWWYRVIDPTHGKTLGWVPEANLDIPVAAG